MPHLSPMNWMIMIISSTLFMSMMMTFFWWTNKVQFPMSPSQNLMNKTNNWLWL